MFDGMWTPGGGKSEFVNGGNGMTREEAARILNPDTYHEESAKVPDEIVWSFMVNEALRLGAKALIPWIRTADRLPPDPDEDYLAIESDGPISLVKGEYIEENQDALVLWMPIPSLTDHIADAGKSEEENE